MTSQKKRGFPGPGPGRPKNPPPAATDVERVERYVACGMTNAEIAAVFGFSVDTLRRTYADALRTGMARRRGEAIDLLWTSARSGNVSAQKAVEAMTNRAAQKAADAKTAKSANAGEEPKAAKVGKKEQKILDAETAGIGSLWGKDLLPSVGN